MSGLPRAKENAENPAEEEIDRLLYVVAELQRMVQAQIVRSQQLEKALQAGGTNADTLRETVRICKERAAELTTALQDCRAENARLRSASSE